MPTDCGSLAELWRDAAWTFDPREVVSRTLIDLSDALRSHGVSQRHSVDTAAWRTIAESLSDPTVAPAAHNAVFDGAADASTLLTEAQSATRGSPRFPFLAGRVGPMWIRLLAFPGGAQISSIRVLPVAVDVQVRKVSEYLGVTATGTISTRFEAVFSVPGRPVSM